MIKLPKGFHLIGTRRKGGDIFDITHEGSSLTINENGNLEWRNVAFKDVQNTGKRIMSVGEEASSPEFNNVQEAIDWKSGAAPKVASE